MVSLVWSGDRFRLKIDTVELRFPRLRKLEMHGVKKVDYWRWLFNVTSVEFGALLGELLVAIVGKIHCQWSGRRHRRRLCPYP